MKSLLTQMLSFATNTNLDFRIFWYANRTFTNEFVRALTKSDAARLYFCTSNYRLKNCYATANLIFRTLC